MKVTHVITPINYGGGENLIINLVEKMDKSVENEVLNLSYSEEFEKHLDKNKIKHRKISDKNLGASPSKKKYLFFLISILCQVFFTNSKIRGQIIHAHGFPANIFIALMRKLGLLKGKKLIFTSHSEKKSEKALVRKFYLFFLKEFDVISAVGEKSFVSMKNIFPELSNKLIKINNGIKVDDTKDFGINPNAHLPSNVTNSNATTNNNIQNNNFKFEVKADNPQQTAQVINDSLKNQLSDASKQFNTGDR